MAKTKEEFIQIALKTNKTTYLKLWQLTLYFLWNQTIQSVSPTFTYVKPVPQNEMPKKWPTRKCNYFWKGSSGRILCFESRCNLHWYYIFFHRYHSFLLWYNAWTALLPTNKNRGFLPKYIIIDVIQMRFESGHRNSFLSDFELSFIRATVSS